jgi:hypothetical protein
MPPGVSDLDQWEEGIGPKVTQVFNLFRDLHGVLTVVHSIRPQNGHFPVAERPFVVHVDIPRRDAPTTRLPAGRELASKGRCWNSMESP